MHTKPSGWLLGQQCQSSPVEFVTEVLLLYLSTAVLANVFIDVVNYNRHMLKALAEEADALGFNSLILLTALPG